MVYFRNMWMVSQRKYGKIKWFFKCINLQDFMFSNSSLILSQLKGLSAISNVGFLYWQKWKHWFSQNYSFKVDFLFAYWQMSLRESRTKLLFFKEMNKNWPIFWPYSTKMKRLGADNNLCLLNKYHSRYSFHISILKQSRLLPTMYF